MLSSIRSSAWTARSGFIVAAVLVWSHPASGQTQLTLDHPAIARRIVQQLALTPGEKVLSIAHPGLFDELLPHLRWEVTKAGGIDLGVIEVMPEPVPAHWDAALLQNANRMARQHYKTMFRDVDAAIMMPGATPAHPAYAAMQDWLNEGRGRTVHFHWIENGSAYPLPGQPLPVRPVIDALYQRALLDTDYRVLADLQARFAAAMRGQEVRVTSSSGTDLRFRIGDRPVNRQDGDAAAARTSRGVILIDREVELPAGVIRVAPLEQTVEGTVVFPPSQWDGRPVDGLRLRFSKGRVVEIQATTGREAVEAEMQRGGTVGGGYVRWNFFTDRTVVVGGTEWVKNGKLAAPAQSAR